MSKRGAQTARKLLRDIVEEEFVARFTERELLDLERAAGGAPIEPTEFAHLLRKFAELLTERAEIMTAFASRLRELGLPAGAPIGPFCAEHGIELPAAIPKRIYHRKR